MVIPALHLRYRMPASAVGSYTKGTTHLNPAFSGAPRGAQQGKLKQYHVTRA